MPAEPRDYATGTKVPVDKTRSDIEKLLQQHGATAFGYATRESAAMLIFELAGRKIRMHLPLPDPGEERFRKRRRGAAPPLDLNASEQSAAHAQGVRERWRALFLIVRAKLQAVKDGIRTVEDEFLLDTVMANDQTVGEWLAPQVAQLYAEHKIPPLLPGLKELPDRNRP